MSVLLKEIQKLPSYYRWGSHTNKIKLSSDFSLQINELFTWFVYLQCIWLAKVNLKVNSNEYALYALIRLSKLPKSTAM